MLKEEIYIQQDKRGYKVFHQSGAYAGTFEALEDGYWRFWPDVVGCMGVAAYVLRALADKLDELNT